MNEIDKKEAQDKVVALVDPIMKSISDIIPNGLTKNQVISILQLFVEIYY